MSKVGLGDGGEELNRFKELVGPIKAFKPYATFSMGRVKVLARDCSYYSKFVGNAWFEVFLKNYRPWYAPWERCVGFSLFYPPELRVPGEILVEDVIDRVAGVAGVVRFGKYKAEIRRLAKDLTVLIPDQEG